MGFEMGQGSSLQGSSSATTGDASFGSSKLGNIKFGSMARGINPLYLIIAIVIVVLAYLIWG